MAYTYIDLRITEHVALLELQRSAKKNALCIAMVQELHACFSDLKENPKIQALLIRGQEDVFSAGGDLKEMQDLSEEEAQKRSAFVQETFSILRQMPCPVVAFIQGICYGGGLELALHCDIRLAADNTRLAFPEVKYGMIPGAGGTVLLREYIPAGDAFYFLSTGNEIPLDKALTQGLIQESFPLEVSEQYLQTQINHYQQLNPKALSALKKIQQLNCTKSLDERYLSESVHFANLLVQNGRKGIQKKFK